MRSSPARDLSRTMPPLPSLSCRHRRRRLGDVLAPPTAPDLTAPARPPFAELMRRGRGSAPLPAGFGTLWTSVAVDLVGFGIVFPLLPLYARRFGASAAGVGFVAGPALGALSAAGDARLPFFVAAALAALNAAAAVRRLPETNPQHRRAAAHAWVAQTGLEDDVVVVVAPEDEARGGLPR